MEKHDEKTVSRPSLQSSTSPSCMPPRSASVPSWLCVSVLKTLHNRVDKTKKPSECWVSLIGSGGWIRTSDQLINSQLRYHCATPERLNGG